MDTTVEKQTAAGRADSSQQPKAVLDLKI